MSRKNSFQIYATLSGIGLNLVGQKFRDECISPPPLLKSFPLFF